MTTATNFTPRGRPEPGRGLDQRVQAAVVDTLYQNVPLLQVANVFIALVTAHQLRLYLPAWATVAWLLAMVGVSLGRLWLARRYGRDDDRARRVRVWCRRATAGSLASGLLLGMTAFTLLLVPGLTLVYFLLLVAVGMLAGSVPSLTAHLPTFRAYYFSLALPYTGVLFWLGLASGPEPEALFSIALMLLVYTLVMYFFGMKTHVNTRAALSHRFEHEALSEELAEEIRRREGAQDELMLSSRIIANVREGIVVTDSNNRIIRINTTFSDITGYSEAEVLGKTPRVVGSGKQDKAFYQRMWQALAERGEWEGEIWNRRKNGEIYPEWLSISVIRDARGEISNFVGWFRDITERKREEERLSYLAHYDVLTGLPNRKLVIERLDTALADCRQRGELLAVLFVDLNLFKEVNDRYGHDVGDILLREVALRLKQAVREEDTVARLGGDEFIILLRNLHDGSSVERIANKFLELIEPPFQINGKVCRIGCAIGISMAPVDAIDRKALLKCADLAMYQAKQDRSRSRWVMCGRALPNEPAHTVVS